MSENIRKKTKTCLQKNSKNSDILVSTVFSLLGGEFLSNSEMHWFRLFLSKNRTPSAMAEDVKNAMGKMSRVLRKSGTIAAKRM